MHEHAFFSKALPHPYLSLPDYEEGGSRRGLYAWDARLKLALLVLAVAANVILAHLWLSMLLFGLSLGLVLQSRVPWRHFALFFLAPAWATLIVFLGFAAGFGATPVFSWGPLTLYREGMVQGLAAAARVASDMSWMAAVFLTTPFNRVLEALKWFRVPAVLLDTIALTYRYASLLIEEFHLMRDAARSRGGLRGYGNTQRSTALILAQVMLRAYDRAARIQNAMLARGANASPQAEETCVSEDDHHCPNRCDVTPVGGEENGAILACHNLSFGYNGVQFLRDISFSVARREVVVLCGPNGAGKTTLLKLFAGMLTPGAGEIVLCGRRLNRKTRNDAFRHVGLLSQDPNDQLFCTHVREDIAYGPQNLGLAAPEVARLVNTAMELMEVEHLAARPIHRLSHGEMKRVGLAGIIAMRPPLILLDEPAAGLDPAAAGHLLHLLRHLNSHHGYTFIMVTHDINLASQVATRVIVLNEGRVAADGPARQILTDEKLLLAARLEPPILTKLFQRVMDHSDEGGGIPVTIDEAAALLTSRKETTWKLPK